MRRKICRGAAALGAVRAALQVAACATLLTAAGAALLAPAAARAQAAPELATVTAPQVKSDEAPYLGAGSGMLLTHQQLIALVQAKIRYVFVIYQENRSFDSYFGTFPGADGLYSQPPAATPGYYQPIVNTDGKTATIVPFRIGPEQFSWDTDDLEHSHAGLAAKTDVAADGVPLMDRFSETEELKYAPAGAPTLRAKQFGELAMAHEDCDTVPFLWHYADHFVLFDHVFQDLAGPSAPGNLAIFAAQSGQTQYALHPAQSFANPAYRDGQGEPVLDENDPLWGSADDTLKNVPVNPADAPAYKPAFNQTYASIALTLAGGQAQAITAQDQNPATDLADIRDDIGFLAGSGKPAVDWRWYQEGYDQEANGDTTHAAYVTHHDGPQYFGYIANNPVERAKLRGLGDFFTSVSGGTLPAGGGVFYLKGGYQNPSGMKPADPLPAVQTNFTGDDDHPAYADAAISEALVAKEVNAVADSKYWAQSAIIITWSNSEGDYDHVPPPVLRTDPSGIAASFGPRVPLILISPFAKVHQISHQTGSQSSVVRFIDEVFNLNPLAALPDEAKGRAQGADLLHQSRLGPLDEDPEVGDLLSAFDAGRLLGTTPALPAAFARIGPADITAAKPYTGQGCAALGMMPEDFVQGIPNKIPADFNPLPTTNPSPAD